MKQARRPTNLNIMKNLFWGMSSDFIFHLLSSLGLNSLGRNFFMVKWMKKYLVYVILGLSLLLNVTTLQKNNSLSKNLKDLQNLMDTTAISFELYNEDEELIKEFNYLPSEAGLTLYDLLLILDGKDILNVEISSAGFITDLNQVINGKENRYWSIFSPTNVECKGFREVWDNYDDTCQVGTKDILISFNEKFIFRVIVWG